MLGPALFPAGPRAQHQMGAATAKLSPAPQFDLGTFAAALTAENQPDGVGPFTKEFVAGNLSQAFFNSLEPEDKADAALVLAGEVAEWAAAVKRPLALDTSVAILDAASFVIKTTASAERTAEATRLREAVRDMLPRSAQPASPV